MIYLEEVDIKNIGIIWNETIQVIEDAVKCLGTNDFAQPIKPYLRYRDLKNRIIAMPAFIGGNFNVAGIKWISSFPDNIEKGIPRAHSVMILNDADTGEPIAIINTALLSIIRTASVSGLMIKYFQKVRIKENIKLGIIGFGPIGQHHLKMCGEILSEKIDEVFLYDIKGIDLNVIDEPMRDKVTACKFWQDAFLDADVFITCTVSNAAYIDKQPKEGAIHLNVSLRDYKIDCYDYFKDAVIVDDWDEVCRENTDIQRFNVECGLLKEDTKNIIDVVFNNAIRLYDQTSPILFNPMGMAVFDMAITSYYYNLLK